MFFMALIIAQTQSARCAEPGGASEKLMATIERPTTTIQVLQNFKFALDNDLFLRDDFYTDENLGKFFAANKVFWYEMTPARTSGFVYTQYSVGFSLIHGVMDEKGNVIANGKKRGGGTINAAVTADSIIELFGKPMKITDPYATDNSRHPTPLIEKTHELGNLAIEYRFDRPSSTASLNCTFHGDGTVKGCGFGNSEK
jgi:hypothetical protein